MKFHFKRNKPRNILVSLINRSSKLLPLSKSRKLKLFLNLNWIFWRLSLEQADSNYGFSDQSMRRKNLEFLLNKLNDKYRVMDVGCKFGRMTSIIAEKSQFVVGIDHDENAISIANENNKCKNLDFFSSDAFDYLEKNDDNFDVIVLSHILEHLDNPKDFMAKFKSYFTYFYIEVPDIDDSYLNHYRNKEKVSLLYTDHDHIWEFDRESLMDIIAKSGLKVIDSEYRYGVQKYWCTKL